MLGIRCTCNSTCNLYLSAECVLHRLDIVVRCDVGRALEQTVM